jgi:hypothetical protein
MEAPIVRDVTCAVVVSNVPHSTQRSSRLAWRPSGQFKPRIVNYLGRGIVAKESHEPMHVSLMNERVSPFSILQSQISEPPMPSRTIVSTGPAASDSNCLKIEKKGEV